MLPRRDFLQRAGTVALGACRVGVCGVGGRAAFARVALPLLGAACATVPYVRGDLRDGVVYLPFAALDADGRALVEVPGVDLPIFVRRVPGGGASAFSTRCSHRGCEVEPAADRFVCPCHGSEYALDGAVLRGPAQRPLEPFRVVETADGLSILLTPRGAS